MHVQKQATVAACVIAVAACVIVVVAACVIVVVAACVIAVVAACVIAVVAACVIAVVAACVIAVAACVIAIVRLVQVCLQLSFKPKIFHEWFLEPVYVKWSVRTVLRHQDYPWMVLRTTTRAVKQSVRTV